MTCERLCRSLFALDQSRALRQVSSLVCAAPAFHNRPKDKRERPMDARTSRYHEVYARSLRDPRGVLGRGCPGDRLVRAADHVFDGGAGVYGRWFVGATCNTCYNAIDRHVARRPRQPDRADLRSPGHQHDAHLHLQRAAGRDRDARRRAAGFRRQQGRPRHHLHADGAGSACSPCSPARGIGAIHSVVFGGFAAKELATRIDDCKPKLILSRKLRHRARARRAVQAAARSGDRARAATSRRPASSCNGRKRGDAVRRAAIIDWARCASRAREPTGDCVPVPPPTRSTSSTRRDDRHSEGRRARQWRPHGRAEMVDEKSLRRRARRGLLVGAPTSAGWSATATSSTRRCCTAARRFSTRASRSARRMPARSGG